MESKNSEKDFKLWVREDEEDENSKVPIIIPADLVKYFQFFNNTREEGFFEADEEARYHLEPTLWKFTIDAYREHDRWIKPEESPLEWILVSTPVTREIQGIALNDLYRMIRIMDYYISPPLVKFISLEIIRRLLTTPLNLLQFAHPKVRIPLLEELRLTLSRKDKFFTSYALRVKIMRLILSRYVETHELVEMILRHAPLPIDLMISGVYFALIKTEDGLYSYGETGPFNRRCLTLSQLEEQRRDAFTLNSEITRRKYDALLYQNSIQSAVRTNRELVDMYQEVAHRYQEVVNSEAALKARERRFLAFSAMSNREVIQFACGDDHCAIMTNDGLYTCGSNSDGQLGTKIDAPNTLVHVDLHGHLPKLVACGPLHTVVITIENWVYICGKANTGKVVPFQPVPVSFSMTLVPQFSASAIIRIACLLYVTLFLNVKGELFVCNSFGVQRVPMPKRSNGSSVLFRDIVSGTDHLVLLDSLGAVYTYGLLNDRGQLGSDDLTISHRLPTLVPSLADKTFANIFAGPVSSFFIEKTSRVTYACGDNTNFRLGHDGPIITTSPLPILTPASKPINSITAMKEEVFFLIYPDLFVYKGAGLFVKQEIQLVTTRELVEKPLYIEILDDDEDEGPIKRAKLGCYQCGHTKDLARHNNTERLFCYSTNCLEKYEHFEV